MSDIPYTQEDEEHNLRLLSSGRKADFNSLITYNQNLIRYVAKKFKSFLKFKISLNELELYATEGFYLACRAYNYTMSFIDFTVFYTEQFIFYQVYNEYFLTELPIHKRIKIQKLYNELLKNLDKGSGLNYFDAISNAAEAINMPLSTAINLIAAFMQLSVKDVNECDFAEEVEKMSNWVLDDKKPKNINNAPLPFILTLMEAQMQEKESIECRIPFKAICEKFSSLVFA